MTLDHSHPVHSKSDRRLQATSRKWLQYCDSRLVSSFYLKIDVSRRSVAPKIGTSPHLIMVGKVACQGAALAGGKYSSPRLRIPIIASIAKYHAEFLELQIENLSPDCLSIPISKTSIMSKRFDQILPKDLAILNSLTFLSFLL